MFGLWLTLAAILAVAASSGYVLYRAARPGITDSPWFWLFAFSATGLVGLLAISPKYDDRQKRLEARYEGRQRAQASVQRQAAGNKERGQQAANADSQPLAPVQDDYEDRRLVPLHFLASALLLAAVFTGYMLLKPGYQRP